MNIKIQRVSNKTVIEMDGKYYKEVIPHHILAKNTDLCHMCSFHDRKGMPGKKCIILQYTHGCCPSLYAYGYFVEGVPEEGI